MDQWNSCFVKTILVNSRNNSNSNGIALTCKQYPIFTFCVVFVCRIGQLLESLAAMETDSEEKTTKNEDSLG